MRRSQIFKKRFTVFFILLLSLFPPLLFADFAPTTDQWHYMIAPYGWLAAVNGELSVDGTKHDFSESFPELLRNLDGAAELHLEGGYGPWSLMLDPTYIKQTMTKRIGSTKLELTAKTWLTDMGLFYQVAGFSFAKEQYLSFELLGGARNLDVTNYLNIDRNFSTSRGANYTTPIGGGRIKYDFNRKMELWFRGDVGGFNIDHVTNTWGTTLGFGYAASQHIELGVAYRVLKININQPASSANVILHGPVLGIAFVG